MRTRLLALAIALTPLSAIAQVACKDVNAPASDIITGVVRLPDPSECFSDSCSALLFSDELPDGRLDLNVGPGKAGVVLLGPGAADWSIRADGDSFLLERTNLTPGLPARALALPVGQASLELLPPDDDARCAVLVADGVDTTRLRAHAESLIRRAGEPVTIRAEAIGGVIIEGDVRATAPDGRVVVSELKGDGTATFTPDTPGDWSVRVRASVLDGAALRVRTTQDVLRVGARTLSFDGSVRLDVHDDGRHTIAVPVRTLGVDAKLILACELWGVAPDGVEVPVCWAARVHTIAGAEGRAELELGFDPAWIHRAGVDPSTLFVRALRAHDTGGAAVLAYHERIALENASDARPVDRTPKTQLRSGAVVEGAPAPSSRSIAGHVIMFSHGYCSDGNPFDITDFTGDLATFLDTNQNRSHDEFALLIEARGRDVKSMGLVAHSQGGCASAHLYTFYWSALDWAQGPRLIQTVGTPWQGTPLAGNAAVLGDIFGAGCGSNTDLSTSGAPVWLSLIPTSTRERITYHTTAFEDRPFSFDFCQFASDLLLSDPDDGVIENSRGQLPGANNGGFVEGWCHTDGMRDPAQCTDVSRNAVMNQEAAR